jgi:hypothetical protein
MATGGIVLMLLALRMMTSPAKKEDHEAHVIGRDVMQMAIYPLAAPATVAAGIDNDRIVTDDIRGNLFLFELTKGDDCDKGTAI